MLSCAIVWGFELKALLFAALLLQANTAEQPASTAPEKPSLDCSKGGFERDFGGTKWVVFGCSDQKTIVIYSAKGNPAMPFYFIRYPKGDGFSLYGEGNGDKSATAPAFEQLKTMSPSDWAGLLEQLNAAPQIAK